MTTRRGTSPTVDVHVAGDTVVAGQPLEVTVRYRAERPVELTDGDVELIRHGAVAHFERGWMGGGGTVSFRRHAVLGRADLDVAGPLAAGRQLVRRLELAVPAGEMTVAGFLVQQEYAVRARIRVAHGGDAEGATAVHVTCADADRGRVAATGPVVDDAGFATLGLAELSSRRLVGGLPVRGVVTVDPKQAGQAREVRVELVLHEHVPPRADQPLEEDRTRATVVAVTRLAEHQTLEPGRTVRFPFTVPAPLPLPAPSTSRPEFVIRWLLRAVLDRSLRRDPTTTIELCATDPL